MRHSESFDTIEKGRKYVVIIDGMNVELGKFNVLEKNENVVLLGNIKNKNGDVAISKNDFGNYGVFEIEGGVLLS